MEMEAKCESQNNLGKVAKKNSLDVYSNVPPSITLPRLSLISPTVWRQLNLSGY